MRKRDHYRINFNLAAPVMIGQLGHIMVSVADSIMVGQLGTYHLAAVALGNSLFAMFMVFGIGMAFGLTPLVAQADGKHRHHLQRVLLHHSFWLNLGFGLLIFGLVSALVPLLPYMNQDPEVIELAGPYMYIVSSSVVPLMLYLSFKQFAEGLSNTRVAMVISVAFNLVNVGLNYLLIYGAFGFPELGINGAGWATLIARIGMLGAMWWYIARHPRFQWYKIRMFTRRSISIIYRRLLQVGVPSGLQSIFEVSAFSLAAIFAGMLGAIALAAHQVAINIASVSYMAVTGLGAAAAVRVGNQTGRKDAKNLRMAASSIFRMSLTWMGFAGLVILIFREELAGFYSQDPEVLDLAQIMLLVVVVFQLSDGLQAVALGALRGFTDVKVPTLITFFAYWVVTLPAAYILSQYTPMGVMGIWYALAGGLTISAALLITRFYKIQNRLASKWQ
jgi:MATE family multidrug resistance protein